MPVSNDEEFDLSVEVKEEVEPTSLEEQLLDLDLSDPEDEDSNSHGDVVEYSAEEPIIHIESDQEYVERVAKIEGELEEVEPLEEQVAMETVQPVSKEEEEVSAEPIVEQPVLTDGEKLIPNKDFEAEKSSNAPDFEAEESKPSKVELPNFEF